MTVKCHVCDRREAENPSVKFPVCHPCRQSIWALRNEYPEAILRGKERRLCERLAAIVLVLRRVKAAQRGVESLSPILVPTPPKS